MQLTTIRIHRYGRGGKSVQGQSAVYICVCNALNERKVDEAIAAGASSVGRIYKHHGCTPKCGKCVPVMRDRLPESAPAIVVADIQAVA